jgi:hypothetical protein
MIGSMSARVEIPLFPLGNAATTFDVGTDAHIVDVSQQPVGLPGSGTRGERRFRILERLCHLRPMFEITHAGSPDCFVVVLTRCRRFARLLQT